MNIDLFKELDFNEVGKLLNISPNAISQNVPDKVPDMLTKKSKLTAKQKARNPMTSAPILSEELNLCIKVNENKFIINGGAIVLSGLLSDWRKKNPDQNEIMLTIHNTSHVNTPRLIKYIVQYLDMWTGYYTHCDYPIRLPIRTSDVSQVLYSQDWRFIKAYIDAEMRPVQIVPLQAGFLEHARSLNLKTKAEIATLVELLDQATYLKIDSLEKKIYTYAATLLYDKTAVDIAAYN